jgi:hypothetical protein
MSNIHQLSNDKKYNELKKIMMNRYYYYDYSFKNFSEIIKIINDNPNFITGRIIGDILGYNDYKLFKYIIKNFINIIVKDNNNIIRIITYFYIHYIKLFMDIAEKTQISFDCLEDYVSILDLLANPAKEENDIRFETISLLLQYPYFNFGMIKYNNIRILEYHTKKFKKGEFMDVKNFNSLLLLTTLL